MTKLSLLIPTQKFPIHFGLQSVWALLIRNNITVSILRYPSLPLPHVPKDADRMMSFPVSLLAAVRLMIQVARLVHAGALVCLAVLVIAQKACLLGALLSQIGFALLHLETDVAFCVRRVVFSLQAQKSGGFLWPRKLISHLWRSWWIWESLDLSLNRPTGQKNFLDEEALTPYLLGECCDNWE